MQIVSESSFIVFTQKHSNGFEIVYHINFDKNKPSQIIKPKFNDTIDIELIESKIVLNNIEVFKYYQAPEKNCLDVDNDSLVCSEVYFFTKEYGLISDVDRDLMSINKIDHPFSELIEKIKFDKHFFQKTIPNH